MLKLLRVAAAVACVALVAGCAQEEGGDDPNAVDPNAVDPSLGDDEALADLEVYRGETLVLSGEVAEAAGPLTFEMSTEGGRVVVVAALETTPPAFDMGDDLVATGTVLEFDEAYLEKTFTIEVTDEVVEAYDDTLALVATKIATDDEVFE